MNREQTTIRIPKETKEQIEEEAGRLNISFNGMVNRLLYEGLKIIRQDQQE